MQTEVSVITPVFDPVFEFLSDSYKDLQKQNCNWEWIIEFDGPIKTEIPNEIVSDSRVKIFESTNRCGIAITRNRALLRSKADIVHALDYDDRLEEDALSFLIKPLQGNDWAVYSSGAVDDLIFKDGKWVRDPFPQTGLLEGRLDPGWNERQIRDEEGHFLAPPPTFFSVKKDYILALGGWGASERCEDLVLMNALFHLYPGWYVDRKIGMYRKHSGNITAKLNPEMKRMGKGLAQARIAAIKKLSQEND